MKCLLDTHALIWYFEDSPHLPEEAKKIIDDAENSIYICSASLWEIAIKVGLDKLKINLNLDELYRIINESGLKILQIEQEHLVEFLTLPFFHRDPFDRLLVSTALCENLTIITKDENIQKYDVPFVWGGVQ